MDNFDHKLLLKTASFQLRIQKRSDRLMDYFLAAYFLVGILLANFYDTWFIAFGVGSVCVIAYYSVKFLLPNSSLYQYVLSAILGVFMALFIYELHGLFEMHFFAFIGSAVLITYQKWKLQLPILVVVLLHHALFGYLQNIGVSGIYFTSLSDYDVQTFLIHILLATIIFFVCGLWAFQLQKYNQRFVSQTIQLLALQKEAELSIERRDHAEMLKKINAQLEAKAKELILTNFELEQFAYVASHDLQEPLRTITSFLRLLKDRYEVVIDERGKQYIHFATDGAQRMKQIINDLLEFSKAGKTDDKREKINLDEMIKGIISLFHQQITAQGVRLQIGKLPTLLAFKAPVRQVFQNLISNALKYQAQHSIPVIKINCEDKGEYWLFEISDNGIGIPKVHWEDIFIIFRRLHAQTTYPGTGMGLAVTKKIIEFMGGKIWVQSEPGQGSQFFFTMPKL